MNNKTSNPIKQQQKKIEHTLHKYTDGQKAYEKTLTIIGR